MANQTRIAAVTGANKGIGLAIVRNLALSYPTSALSTADSSDSSSSPRPLLIYLTARDPSRGAAALDALRADPALADAKVLAAHGGPVSLAFKQLDISDAASIDRFAADLAREHGRSIDVVVNNAGVALDGFDARVVRDTLATNYHGTLRATARLLPLLRPGGSSSRLVNVASTVGALSRYPDALRRRFREASGPAAGESAEEVAAATTAIMDEFEDAVKAGEHEAKGFPSAAYAVSKAGVIGATRAVALWEKARAEKEGREYSLVNSCCPGYVNTDMTKGRGVKSVDEGARTPVFLALGDLKGVTGEFWHDEKVKEW